MVKATLPESASSIKQHAQPTATVSDDHGLLVLLLGKLVSLVEQLWQEEMKTKTSWNVPLSPRQEILRKVHQALGEWSEHETLSRRN